MAVNTRDRRFSIIGLTSPTIPALPDPDGTLDIGDRPQLLKLYAGFSLTGGSSFDYEYSLASGEHTFFDKSHRKALVIPNYVIVSSPEGSETVYTGSASHPDSAILEMRYYETLKVTSNAQAQSIADAILSHAVMDAEKGAATVPMNVGQEIYDYIKITDKREGDFRIGNVGYLKRHYKGGTFDTEVHLGSVVLSGMPGTGIDYLKWLAEQRDTIAIVFIIDGGGAAITTGSKGYLKIPFRCIITGWTIYADQFGDIVVDVKACNHGDFPTTTSIAGTEKPTLSNVDLGLNYNLTSWTTKIYVLRNILEFYVDSVSTVERVTITLKAKRI